MVPSEGFPWGHSVSHQLALQVPELVVLWLILTNFNSVALSQILTKSKFNHILPLTTELEWPSGITYAPVCFLYHKFTAQLIG